VTGNAEPLSTLAPALRTGGLRAVSSSGVLGDPSGARAEDGHELLTAMAGDLVATIALRWPA
jgi:creatinine amidohydrolase